MEETFPLAIGWNDLTEEERYELELKFAESYEWAEAHGLYDVYPDENSPEEMAWTEYVIEQEKFKWEAVSFYKKYLEYHGEKKPSVVLREIFYNNDKLLNFFLNRISNGNLKGTEIVWEFYAIMKLQEDKKYKLVNEERKLEPLRVSLSELGFDTKKRQTWFDGFANCKLGKKVLAKRVDRIMEVYNAFVERNQ